MGRRTGAWRTSSPWVRAATVASALSAVSLTTVGVRRSLLRVKGLSMRPTLRDGDLVATVPLPPIRGEGPLHGRAWETRRRLVRPGAIVVIAEPGNEDHLIIKRVATITPEGVDVIGDDPGWSIDSRTFGTVPHRDVRRLVVGRVPDVTDVQRTVQRTLRERLPAATRLRRR